MPSIRDGFRRALIRELDAFSREVESYPDDALLWQTVPGVANATGNLALHVAGNLQYFIGVVLGGGDYARDREAEFGRRSGTRAEVLAELARARHVVGTVLARMPDDALARDYPEAVFGHRFTTGVFLIHLTSHLAHHLGQAGYLRRTLTGDGRSVAPISISAFAAALEQAD